MALTERVKNWQSRGTTEEFRGHDIHVFSQQGEGTPMVFLHGFPSSSYDWKLLFKQPGLANRRILAFDFLGFGLSAKPRDHVYKLGWQADLTEELVKRHFPDEKVFLVGHDMGTSVSTELLARDIRGELSFGLVGAMLFNGSIVLDQATLTRSQKILRSRFGGLASRLSSERVFTREFGAIFSPDHPLSAEEAADQWCLVCHNDGRTLGHKLIHYLEERAKLTDRWHGAVSDWKGDLRLTWAELDPVATTAVLEAVIKLRPGVPVQRLPDLGHYPQVEDPAAIAEAIARSEAPA